MTQRDPLAPIGHSVRHPVPTRALTQQSEELLDSGPWHRSSSNIDSYLWRMESFGPRFPIAQSFIVMNLSILAEPKANEMTPNSTTRQRGAVVLVALAVLALLSVLAISFASVMRLERSASANHVEGSRAQLVALAGLHRALAELHATEFLDPVPSLDKPWVYKNDDGTDFGIGIPLEDAVNPSFRQGADQFGSYSGIVGASFITDGDRYKLRVVDKAGQLDLGLPADTLGRMLDDLGLAIEQELAARGLPAIDPVAGRGAAIAALRDQSGGFDAKEELRQILSEQELDALSDHVSFGGFVDQTTTRSIGIVETDGIPRFVSAPRAPVNINSATWSVLVSTLTGLAVRGGAPVSFDDAQMVATAIIAHRSSDDAARGPFESWPELNDLIDGLALSPEQATAIKVNANPNTTIHELNPDRPINVGAGKADLTLATTEFIFFSPGIFEIESLGLVHDQEGIVAAKSLIATVKVMDLQRVTTQAEFEQAFDVENSDGIVSHPSSSLGGSPSAVSGYVGARPRNPDAGDLVADFSTSPADRIFDLSPDQGAITTLRTDRPEDGGDLFADGVHQSSTKQRRLGYSDDALPTDRGSLSFWVKLDRGEEGTRPIVRSSQALDAQTGVQFDMDLSTDGTDLRIRTNRTYYDQIAALGGADGGSTTDVPFNYSGTTSEGTFAGKGVPNEWHHIVVEWTDTTSHRTFVDGQLVPQTEVILGEEGPLAGRSPYDESFDMGSDPLIGNHTLDDIVIRNGGPSAPPSDPPADEEEEAEKVKNNNGHGNNEDGVDVSNPGKGKGGPNGEVDASGDVDDEKKSKNGSSDGDGDGDGGESDTTVEDIPTPKADPNDFPEAPRFVDRFETVEPGRLGRYHGSFRQLALERRVGILSATVFLPGSYEGQSVAGQFGYQVRLIANGEEHAAEPNTDRVVAPDGLRTNRVEFAVDFLADGAPGTPPVDPEPEPDPEDDEEAEKVKNNNGHGNNEDGVDVSNPGKGKGGPNGEVDASGDVDDEKKNKNNGNDGNGGNDDADDDGGTVDEIDPPVEEVDRNPLNITPILDDVMVTFQPTSPSIRSLYWVP